MLEQNEMYEVLSTEDTKWTDILIMTVENKYDKSENKGVVRETVNELTLCC